ncbi:PASTA domain-containing protein [Spongisporangium articulatum]|uniref:non-specific serine/threonine protein kinase n=1 Tax=Spongisporangium articulatum TaxID=3362603 RepID=A0ABW8AST7_9ACTN
MDLTVKGGLLGRMVDDRYLVESKIADGGMATVYLAVDRRLDREVALKVMHADFGGDEEYASRFVREARSAARLSHPNIVQVFDQGTDRSEPGHELLYLAMEYLPGRTLREVLAERGALTPREASSVMVPLLDALAAAHRGGIVHRDVKPENIILTDDGRVKVADFGLAKAIAAPVPSDAQGQLFGTAAYLAPELVSRGIADHRADLYAAGIVLFELLTGAQPYSGGEPVQVAHRHVHERVPAPSVVAPGLPDVFDALVLQATEHDPDRRPATAEDMLAEVRHIRATMPAAALDIRAVTPSLQPVTRSEPTRAMNTAGMPVVGGAAAGAFAGGTAGAVGAAGAAAGTAAFSAGPATAHTTALSGAPTAFAPPPSFADRPTAVGGPATTALGPPAGPGGPGGPSWPGGNDPNAGYGGLPRLSVHDEDDAPLVALGGPGAARPPMDPEKRKRLLIGAGGGAAVLLLLIVWWFAGGPGSKIPVPLVVGSTQAEATATLKAAGLTVVIVPQYSDDVDKGKVIQSDPGAGEGVSKGGEVTIEVSQGPETVKIPDVAKLSEEDARAKLKAANGKIQIAAESTEKYSNKIDKGQVIGTDPAAGKTIKVNSQQVTLIVSRGPAPIKVPGVVGQNVDAAKAQLSGLGLKVKVEETDGDGTQAPGTVLDQSPAKDANVAKGDTVTLTVVKVPDGQVQVPDVRNKNVEEANGILNGAGLTMNVINGGGNNPNAVVTFQSATPGSYVQQGTQVNVFVGNGPGR